MKATKGTTGRAGTPVDTGADRAIPALRRQTMQAIVHDRYGSADVLRVDEVGLPTIGDDEVLVRVHAAGLDRGTWHLMAGLPYLFRLMGPGLRKPKNPVLGRDVTGGCSTAKMDLVRSLGADHVIDYTRDDFATGRHRYDLILDIGGNAPLSRLRRALTPTGTLVLVGGEGGGRWTGGMGRQLRAVALSPFVRQRLTMKTPKEHYTDLERLTQLIEAGDLTPTIDKVYPLPQAPDAMRHLQAGHARGKIVITVIDAG